MKEKINRLYVKAANKANEAVQKVKEAVANKRGDGYVDTAIKIIIAVVLGGLILAGLYALFNTVVIPQMTSKVTSFFSYNGT